MKKISAGLLMYRIKNGVTEVLLVHPGGPFYKNKDDGVWDIPKGESEDHEKDLLEVAKREFEEEIGWKPVGDFKSIGTCERPNKIVHAWTFQGDCDPATIKSNTCMVEWPPKSGKQIEILEVDRAGFFDMSTAKQKVWPYLVPLIEMFERMM
ncbi:MAG: NUDIX domain-containing protein [Patescibacteria group bacterium]|nr:NUDIX domain-containing protein [Patescibacteria group bacterium]